MQEALGPEPSKLRRNQTRAMILLFKVPNLEFLIPLTKTGYDYFLIFLRIIVFLQIKGIL